MVSHLYCELITQAVALRAMRINNLLVRAQCCCLFGFGDQWLAGRSQTLAVLQCYSWLESAAGQLSYTCVGQVLVTCITNIMQQKDNPGDLHVLSPTIAY